MQNKIKVSKSIMGNEYFIKINPTDEGLTPAVALGPNFKGDYIFKYVEDDQWVAVVLPVDTMVVEK